MSLQQPKNVILPSKRPPCAASDTLSCSWKFALASLAVGFVTLMICYGLVTPAWETNDELDHVANIEYAVKHPLTFMPIAYEGWHETHQPPLYYWLASVWQRLLRIEPFTVSHPPARAKKAETGKLIMAHERFNEVQQRQMIALHKLRLISPFFGITTVALGYLAALKISGQKEFALSTAALVALHPKFMIISAVITNDSLAICVGSVFLLLCLYYVSPERAAPGRLLLSAAIGVTAGAAFLTKLNLLPLVGLLIPVAFLLAPHGWRAKTVDAGLFIASGSLVAGWWLVHNRLVYGDWLAARASHDWLVLRLPNTLQPVAYSDSERFLEFLPRSLFRTFWYNGGWNQQVAPFALYFVLWCLAAICLFESLKSQFLVCRRSAPRTRYLWLVWSSAFAGLTAVCIIAQQTIQAEGRIAFVALGAFAILLTLGSQSALERTRIARFGLVLWPVALALFDLYVLIRFVLPLRQL